MNKSKWFALIFVSIPLLAFALVTYAAEIYYDLPTLVVTKPAQPVSAIAPSGALHVPFTRADLTARGGDIIVEDITVVKNGPSDDEAFEDIVLLDSEGEELGEGSLDDEHTIHFTGPIYIPRNTTLRLTVAANIVEDLEEFEGQISSFTITDIKASGVIPVNLKP